MTSNVMDIVERNIEQTKERKFSKDAVISVWNSISKQIEEDLCRGYAVCILGLGTFTLSEWKIHNGSKSCFQSICPLFVLSNKIVLFYNVSVCKYFTTYKIPTKQLNFALIAKECHFKREDVCFIVSELIQEFVKLIGNNQDAVIVFPNIGKLEVRNKIFNTNFCSEFEEKVKTANSCSHDVNVCIKKFYTFPYNSGNFFTS